MSYSPKYYAGQSVPSWRSAKEVVPLVVDLVAPQSVVDVGCGVGTWLAAFAESGITDYLGLDGDYVSAETLHIPPSHFQAEDLRYPVSLGRTFDLAVSLEVAEHLPESSAESFVKSLTSLAPVVLFSAAIPHQGGHHHLNEQWPSYWAQHFRKQGYCAYDCIRPKIWNNADVSWWYAQNTILYSHEENCGKIPEEVRRFEEEADDILPLVHPRKYQLLLANASTSLVTLSGRKLKKQIPASMRQKLKTAVSRSPK